MREAMFWNVEGDKRVRCGLCRFRCLIGDGRRGICGVRENRNGVLYSLVYGKAVAESIDPIEKKPLFHYLPGTLSYSIATVGCNFRCLHCQNHQISQWPHEQKSIAGEQVDPDELVRRAVTSGCRSISYTYTEPTIYFEYAYETARLAKKAGLGNVFVSNGYITPEALEMIAPYLDAANIDLKGFTEEFYTQMTGASLQGVLETLRDYRRHGIWLEVTSLLIPGHNDDDEQLQGMASFIADELGRDVPWHVSAFYPTYKLLNTPPTPPDSLHKARKIGLAAGLNYVYTGNIRDADGEQTRCPACRKIVIERRGFRLVRTELDGNLCRFCGVEIAGVFG